MRKINVVLFYILQFTWGLPLNLMGFFVALVLIICGKKPKRHKLCWYFNVGKDWGGLEFGLFFLTDKYDNLEVKNHEFGHAIQNAWFGPFFLILFIWGAIRYWYREIVYYNRGKLPKTAYNSLWFENQANKLGEKYGTK